MNIKEFSAVMEYIFEVVRDTNGDKTSEYRSLQDKFANFKRQAMLTELPLLKTISVAMAKHTISIYDMINHPKEDDVEKWEEKVKDHILYLIILYAAATEKE